jgi:hypothetical protein
VGDASPGVIVFTSVGVVAAVYGFICQIRAERVARRAVKHVRATQPDLWQRLNWLLRVASPVITIRVLRSQHGAGGPPFDQHFARMKHLERRVHLAMGTAMACIALVLIGARFWGWSFD